MNLTADLPRALVMRMILERDIKQNIKRYLKIFYWNIKQNIKNLFWYLCYFWTKSLTCKIFQNSFYTKIMMILSQLNCQPELQSGGARGCGGDHETGKSGSRKKTILPPVKGFKNIWDKFCWKHHILYTDWPVFLLRYLVGRAILIRIVLGKSRSMTKRLFNNNYKIFDNTLSVTELQNVTDIQVWEITNNGLINKFLGRFAQLM